MKMELIKLIGFVGLLYLALGIAALLRTTSRVLLSPPIPISEESDIRNQRKFTENSITGL